MILKSVNRHREGGVWQVFDHVPHFHKVLALASGIQPERRDVVNTVEADERIVECFGNLVAVSGHILNVA